MTSAQASFRKPPGPSEPVALGIDPETLQTLTSLQQKYGDMVSMVRPNGRLAYFVNDAVEVRRILARRHAKYRKGPGFERVKMLLGNGLIVSDGDVWRRSRRMVQPAFGRQNIHKLLQVMVECSERRALRWKALAERDEPCNITAETSDFSLELILISIFGADYESRILNEGDNPFAFLSENSTRDLSVVMKVRHLRELLTSIIEDRRHESAGDEFDFLSMYLEAEDKNGDRFTNSELLDELMTLIVAGFETSANTLSWAWYLISKHPEVEARLLAEANDCIHNGDELSSDALSSMTYTQQVLEETLRLYPPVWLFTRRSNEEDELAAFDVPAGTDIYLSPFVLQRSAHYWSDPELFDPERFDANEQAKKDRPFFPFSLGPRRCIGEYFSFMEMKVHLGLLLPQFRMAATTNSVPELELGINLRSADDIFLQPKER